MSRVETIGRATLYLGNCLEIVGALAPVDHLMTDPPYESLTQAAIGTVPKGNLKGCSTRLGRPLDFDPIDAIRADVVAMGAIGRCARRSFRCAFQRLSFGKSERDEIRRGGLGRAPIEAKRRPAFKPQWRY